MTILTQYTLLVLEMITKGIAHSLPNYQWYFVKRPQLVEYYEDGL